MNAQTEASFLERENRAYLGSGGRSQENREFGFRPAFRDEETGVVYASRYSDGRLAPFHLLDGLPDEVIVARTDNGRIASVKSSLVSGFTLDQRFLTRDEAAALVTADCTAH